MKINNVNVELPKVTLAIAEQIERMGEIEEAFAKGEMKYTDCLRSEYDFLNTVLGTEKTAEIVAGDNIEDVDLVKVTCAVIEVLNAFKEPIEKTRSDIAIRSIKAQMTPEVNKAFDMVAKVQK